MQSNYTYMIYKQDRKILRVWMKYMETVFMNAGTKPAESEFASLAKWVQYRSLNTLRIPTNGAFKVYYKINSPKGMSYTYVCDEGLVIHICALVNLQYM